MTKVQCAAFLRAWGGACVLVMGLMVAGGWAQAQPVDNTRNVVHLSASGSVEVVQDWLQINLLATREGSQAQTVQQQLQQAVDAAVLSLRSKVQGTSMQLRTGGFGVYPRHGLDGKIKGWQGRAELVVEGKDFARITQAVSHVNTMQVAGTGLGLSKEGRAVVHEQAQAQAVQNFQARATQLAKLWGFTGYTMREIHVNSQDSVGRPRMAAMPMAAASMAKQEMADPITVEAGKELVEVSVNGAVQLH